MIIMINQWDIKDEHLSASLSQDVEEVESLI
jgi:hypothetical protein